MRVHHILVAGLDASDQPPADLPQLGWAPGLGLVSPHVLHNALSNKRLRNRGPRHVCILAADVTSCLV